MTPSRSAEHEELQQIEINMFECYITETRFAKFLMECLDKYGSGLPVDETFKAKWYSDRIYVLIQKIKASDAILQGKRSDEDLTAPLLRFC